METATCILEIDLLKIQQNYQILTGICNNSDVAAVVKADAYGLGAIEIAQALQQKGCTDFFVAHIEEGIKLRNVLDNKTNIYVLNGSFKDDTKNYYQFSLTPILNNLEQIEIWQQHCTHLNKRIPCVIHINTGMNRMGIDILESSQLDQILHLVKQLDIKFIMSHLAASEDYNNIYNTIQLEKFKKSASFFPDIKASFANSSGIFLGNPYHFDIVRPGIALYGGNPTPNKINPMYNAIKLTAPIIQLRKLAPESFIGYNMTFTANRDMLIATLPIGYADGYSRGFSNCGEVYIDGHKARVVGRVSMDFITIDVTDIPSDKIFLGANVEIIGDNCTIDKMADIIGTISYDVITQLGNRYKRIYKNHVKHN